MKTLSLALRNLLRNRRRSVSTLLAMVVGLCAIMVFGGYIRDIKYRMQTDYIHRSGHLQIQHKDYLLYGRGNPAAYGISDYENIIALIKKDQQLAAMVRVATPVLQFDGIAGNFAAGVSRTVFATGIVAEDQNRMREWNDYGLQEPLQTLALAGTSADTATIGGGVAKVLNLCAPLAVSNCASRTAAAREKGNALPADIASIASLEQGQEAAPGEVAQPRIEILVANAHGAPNVAPVKVVNAERQGVKEIDDVYVALHFDYAQKLIFGHDEPKATAIVLQLEHTNQIPLARARLNALLKEPPQGGPPLEVLDFETLNPFYGQSLLLLEAIFAFVSVLIAVIVTFTVGNTMSMAVVERTSEIGTLRAMGMRRAGIGRLFLWEGLLLGGLGAGMAIMVQLAIVWLINHAGWTWSPPGRAEPAPLSIAFDIKSTSLLAVGMAVISTLSAVLPAARAALMRIVDALRHV